MSMNSYYVRVFDPLYTYARAEEYVGEQGALKQMLKSIATDDCMADEKDEPRRYACRTAYYRYAPYVAVLLERQGTFYCQTYMEGEPQHLYNLQTEREELRGFFAQAHRNITVLDNAHGRQFIPRVEQVERYVATVMQGRAEYEQQRAVLDDYARRLRELTENADDLGSYDPSDTYHSVRTLADQFLVAMHQALDSINGRTRRALDDCCIPMKDEDAVLQMFGLYVYALRYGLRHGRFLRRRHLRSTAALFNEMLRDMHAFMRENDEIAIWYCEEMQLPENECCTLLAMLESEGLDAEQWCCIGDDLF